MVETKVESLPQLSLKSKRGGLPCLSPVRQVHLEQRLFSYHLAKYNLQWIFGLLMHSSILHPICSAITQQPSLPEPNVHALTHHDPALRLCTFRNQWHRWRYDSIEAIAVHYSTTVHSALLSTPNRNHKERPPMRIIYGKLDKVTNLHHLIAEACSKESVRGIYSANTNSCKSPTPAGTPTVSPWHPI